MVKTFTKKNMSKSSKAWHYFICAKFMTTTNFSAMTKDRARLTYAIHKGKSVDVGLVIERSISNALKIKKVGLPHPHLISVRELRNNGESVKSFYTLNGL